MVSPPQPSSQTRNLAATTNSIWMRAYFTAAWWGKTQISWNVAQLNTLFLGWQVWIKGGWWREEDLFQNLAEQFQFFDITGEIWLVLNDQGRCRQILLTPRVEGPEESTDPLDQYFEWHKNGIRGLEYNHVTKLIVSGCPNGKGFSRATNTRSRETKVIS